jgi:hypothetical protein
MAKRKRTNGQTVIYKTLYRKETPLKHGVNLGAPEGIFFS